MKILASVSELSQALALANLAIDGRVNINALRAVRLVADTGASSIHVITNCDRVISTMAIATVIEPGAVATDAISLAGLVGELQPSATITITGDDSGAAVTCFRSRWRMAVVPISDLAPVPTFKGEPASVVLAGEDLRRALSFCNFATSTERTRYYLNGICLHAAGTGATALRAVASDGHRLSLFDLPPAPAGFPTIIIPGSTVDVLITLLKGKPESVTLRASTELVEITTGDETTLLSKLIAGTFPDYSHTVPPPTGTNAVVKRSELAQALRRLNAIYDRAADPHMRIARIAWNGDGVVHVSHTVPDISDDPIDGETNGTGRFAARLSHMTELLDTFVGERVAIDVDGHRQPVLVTDPDSAGSVVVQMPCVW